MTVPRTGVRASSKHHLPTKTDDYLRSRKHLARQQPTPSFHPDVRRPGTGQPGEGKLNHMRHQFIFKLSI